MPAAGRPISTSRSTPAAAARSTRTPRSFATAELITGAELERALADIVGASSVQGLRRLSGGASREMWSFDAVMPDGRLRGLILRRNRPGPPSGIASPAPERLLLEAAAAERVPVPAVVTGSDD